MRGSAAGEEGFEALGPEFGEELVGEDVEPPPAPHVAAGTLHPEVLKVVPGGGDVPADEVPALEVLPFVPLATGVARGDPFCIRRRLADVEGGCSVRFSFEKRDRLELDLAEGAGGGGVFQMPRGWVSAGVAFLSL